jgi:sporulation protein YlmC with PRC-barrel domain
MDQNDRSERDAAGVGPYARERERLVALSTLGSWSVSDGEPDIRGWEVRTVSGRQLGTVQDLLIDTDAGEVVLVDVDLPGTDRHTLVPIRVVQIDRARRIVLMDSADLPESDVARAPRPVGATPVTQVTEVKTVRYPRTDREVVGDRPRVADDAPARDAAAPSGVERRHADRRRIDRLSTDL